MSVNDTFNPSLAEFDAMTKAAFARLPRRFRAMCENVAVTVEDWPDDGTLEAMEIESREDLLGLYHGISLDRKSGLDVPYGPDVVVLYRMPILLYRDAHGDSVEAIVTHVLVHEIGHHFGLSDEDMEQIEESVA